MTQFRPMLAATVDDVTQLRFPLLASPKLDGVRAVVRNGQVLGRSLKPIPNRYVQRLLGHLEGLDGELILGPPTGVDVFQRTSSVVMSCDGTPPIKLWAFDLTISSEVFADRLSSITKFLRHARTSKDHAEVLPHSPVATVGVLKHLEEGWVEAGYEGVMLRDPYALYKHGRSTFKEHGLMKLKRFADAEARVVGFEPLQHNGNEATVNELGASARSSHKAGLVAQETLGALKVKVLNGPFKGASCNIGTGFDSNLRRHIWMNRASWLGRVVKFKFFPAGSKDAPRFPVYLGERHAADR